MSDISATWETLKPTTCEEKLLQAPPSTKEESRRMDSDIEGITGTGAG